MDKVKLSVQKGKLQCLVKVQRRLGVYLSWQGASLARTKPWAQSPTLRRWNQETQKVKVNLGYIVSLRTNLIWGGGGEKQSKAWEDTTRIVV